MPVKNAAFAIGQILLAEPFMADPYFRRSVILLCDHTEQGTVGFILNKKMDVTINEIMADFPTMEAPVFYGGPVQTNTLHYIHNLGEKLEGSLEITEGIWWGGDFERLKIMILTGEVQEENIRFFVGYAGWTAGQLRTEMEFGTWITANFHPDYIFKMRAQSLWRRVMYNKGDKYEVLSHIPDYPSWN